MAWTTLSQLLRSLIVLIISSCLIDIWIINVPLYLMVLFMYYGIANISHWFTYVIYFLGNVITLFFIYMQGYSCMVDSLEKTIAYYSEAATRMSSTVKKVDQLIRNKRY